MLGWDHPHGPGTAVAESGLLGEDHRDGLRSAMAGGAGRRVGDRPLSGCSTAIAVVRP